MVTAATFPITAVFSVIAVSLTAILGSCFISSISSVITVFLSITRTAFTTSVISLKRLPCFGTITNAIIPDSMTQAAKITYLFLIYFIVFQSFLKLFFSFSANDFARFLLHFHRQNAVIKSPHKCCHLYHLQTGLVHTPQNMSVLLIHL